MSYANEDEDDFSPEDAFNMFTPSIYRPGIKDRSDVDILDPPNSDLYTLDPLSLTTTGLPPTGGFVWKLGDDLSRVVLPTPSIDDESASGGWILGEREDAILLPVILSAIGLCAIMGNVLLLLTIAGLRRMRSGPNLMLANVALADIMFVAVTVPTAVVNHATKSHRVPFVDDDIIGPRVCRFVYYAIFVTVYVTVYTLVVSSVFRFFGELMRGNGRGGHVGGGGTASRRGGNQISVDGGGSSGGGAATRGGGSPPVALSTCSAAVSCAVVWIAFAASHLTFVVQSDFTGLAVFEKPVICIYSPSSGALDSTFSGDQSRVRTLWITFLACAFLLPLTIVCCSSAAVLRMQRRAVEIRRRIPVDDDDRCRQLNPIAETEIISAVDESTVMQNMDNDGRAKREMTKIIMISALARAVCWLPLQIFVLVDVFEAEPDSESTADMYRKAEMFGVCMALVGACVGPPIYRLASREFRDAFRLVIRRVCCCGRRQSRDSTSYVSSRLVVREPSLPPQTVDFQQCLHRQSPISSMSSSSCYSHEPHHPHPHHLPPAAPHHHQHHHNHHRQQQQQQQQQLVNKLQLATRPEVQVNLAGPVRVSTTDVNETILSIISDSSNHINYS